MCTFRVNDSVHIILLLFCNVIWSTGAHFPPLMTATCLSWRLLAFGPKKKSNIFDDPSARRPNGRRHCRALAMSASGMGYHPKEKAVFESGVGEERPGDGVPADDVFLGRDQEDGGLGAPRRLDLAFGSVAGRSAPPFPSTLPDDPVFSATGQMSNGHTGPGKSGSPSDMNHRGGAGGLTPVAESSDHERLTRGELLKRGRERLSEWRQRSKGSVSTANSIMSRLRERAQRDAAMAQAAQTGAATAAAAEKRVSDLQDLVEHLRNGKAEAESEAQKFARSATSLQEGLRAQAERLGEAREEHRLLRMDLEKVCTERDAAVQRCERLREELEARARADEERRKLEVGAAKTEATPSTPEPAQRAADFTALLRDAGDASARAAESTAECRAALEQSRSDATAVVAGLTRMSREELAMLRLPPTPDGRAPPRAAHFNGESATPLLAKMRALSTHINSALRATRAANESVSAAAAAVRPSTVQALLAKAGPGARPDADMRSLIDATERRAADAAQRAAAVSDRCTVLQGQRLELSQRLALREEETSALVGSLRGTISALLPDDDAMSGVAGRAGEGAARDNARGVSGGDAADVPARLRRPPGLRTGAFTASRRPGVLRAFGISPRTQLSARRRSMSRGPELRVCYGRKIKAFNLWEVVAMGGVPVRAEPSTKAPEIKAAKLKYGDIVVASARRGKWVRHPAGWSCSRERREMHMSKMPLVPTPYGKAYLVRKPRNDGLTDIVLTWCRNYGIMASLSAARLIKFITDQAKADVTKQLNAARYELKRAGGDPNKQDICDELRGVVAALEVKYEKTRALAELPSIDRLLQRVKFHDQEDEDGKDGAAAAPNTPDSPFPPQRRRGIFRYLLSFVGMGGPASP